MEYGGVAAAFSASVRRKSLLLKISVRTARIFESWIGRKDPIAFFPLKETGIFSTATLSYLIVVV
jgi:hypothetical protein